MSTHNISDGTVVRLLPDGDPTTLGDFFAANKDGGLDRDAICADLSEHGEASLGGGAAAAFTLRIADHPLHSRGTWHFRRINHDGKSYAGLELVCMDLPTGEKPNWAKRIVSAKAETDPVLLAEQEANFRMMSASVPMFEALTGLLPLVQALRDTIRETGNGHLLNYIEPGRVQAARDALGLASAGYVASTTRTVQH